jgi:hypothetical protein
VADEEKGEGQLAHSPDMVEMAGVEPASRRFEQGHTTSLVNLLVLARRAAGQQAAIQASRCGAHSIPASLPTYRHQWECTSSLLSPADSPPEAGKHGRDRQAVSLSLRRLGGKCNRGCSALFGTCLFARF